jgi:branched-chain amino acid transport system permease protein
MLGAYFAATFTTITGSFLGGVVLALAATLLVGMALEVVAMRRLYGRDHLDHVLATFGLILFFNELVRLVWGPEGRNLTLPPWLNSSVEILPGVTYSMYRLSIIVVALLVALALYLVIMHTRLGMLVRAGASNREMTGALGVNINLLYTIVFGVGAALAGLAGLMQAAILTAQIGMGENILILAFVVIIIGGIGSIRGAFVASVLVGLIDTMGRAFLPDLLKAMLSPVAAATVAPALSSMLIYVIMAVVLVARPEGLFPAARK